MSRDCLLCGAMICGCWWHTGRISMAGIYGLCLSCSLAVGARAGEKVVANGDDHTFTHYASEARINRVARYLDSLQKERAS